jgi:hypothetical protein
MANHNVGAEENPLSRFLKENIVSESGYSELGYELATLLDLLLGYARKKTYPLRLPNELTKGSSEQQIESGQTGQTAREVIAIAIQRALGLKSSVEVAPIACSSFLPPAGRPVIVLRDHEYDSRIALQNIITRKLSSYLEEEFGDKLSAQLGRELKGELWRQLANVFPSGPANKLGDHLRFDPNSIIIDDFWDKIRFEIKTSLLYYLGSILAEDRETTRRLQPLIRTEGDGWPILGSSEDPGWPILGSSKDHGGRRHVWLILTA